MKGRPALGLVGAGEIARVHLPHLVARGGPVFVTANSGAAALAAEFGATAVADLDDLLDRVDIVDVAVPTDAHIAVIERALRAGRHVIAEKPLALTGADAMRIAALAAETGRTVFPAHVVRYFPEYVELHAAVARGDLGEIAVARYSRSGAFPLRTPWFRDPARSGGIVLDLLVHDLDIARWVAGEVSRVSAVARSIPDAAGPVEAAHITLDHVSGAISQISGLWGPQHLDFTTEFSVAGALGTLEHSSAAQRDYRADLARTAGSVATLPAVDPLADPFAIELDEFLDALETGTPARVTLDDGVRAVLLAEAARESVRLGQPVELGAGASSRTERAG